MQSEEEDTRAGDPLLSLVIVNWDGRDDLAEMLDSVRCQTFRDFEVIVVDNGSSDGSLELLAESYPEARVIALDHNTGFAKPNNIALESARGRHIVTLNNDLVLAPDCLAELAACIEAAPGDIFGVGAKLCYHDRREVVQTLGVSPLPNGNGTNVAKNDPSSQHTGVVDIFGPCAGAAVYRRSVLEQIGFFDERYFAYLEDLDLAHRARARGLRALSCGSAVAYHKHSVTAGRAPLKKLYLIERNRLLNLRKHYPTRYLVAETPTTIAIILQYRFGRHRSRLSADQSGWFNASNALRFLKIYASARLWLLRHWSEFGPEHA